MYKNSIVTFIDILGFRELVLKEKPEKILKILQLTQKLSGEKDEKYEYSPFVICFSDSIVRVRQINSEENLRYSIGVLFHELLNLMIIQAELIGFGVLIRGGVSIGDISTDDNKVFGPALIEAYEIESRYACYPRISLSNNVFKCLDDCEILRYCENTLKEEKSEIKKLLRLSEDGTWFIDYLYAFSSEVDEPELYYQFLVKHKKIY